MLNLLKKRPTCCVWPGAVLPLGESGNYLIRFFKENYDIDIEYLEETKTLPGKGPKGGRIDQIFNIYQESLNRFDEIKQKIGAQYAKDIVQEGNHHMYKEVIYLRYFKQLENELLKAGDITKEDIYQGKLK